MSREDWRGQLVRRLRAVERFRVEGDSLLHVPGPRSIRGWRSDGMEGFARTFLGWSFLTAHHPTGEVLPGWSPEQMTSALLCGVRSTWPRPEDNPQTLVEAALTVIALSESAPFTWDRLSQSEGDAVLSFLRSCLTVSYRTSNWLWFAVLVRSFLEIHGDGAPSDGPSTGALLEQIESLYAGGGWYRDGPGRQFDGYNAWAFHFYPFLWARMDPAAAAPWLPLWRARLHEHLDDLRHLVGSSGAPVYQGRSGTYRIALLAPFWLGRLEQSSPLSAGETARLTRLVLQYFDDGRDILRVGWTRPFEPMRQTYSGAGSPYWALKGFVGLLLDPADAVWTAPEEPLPIERGDFTLVVHAPGWLVTGTAADGIVRVVNHGTDGSDHDRPRPDLSSYGRLGYSTVTGPTYGRAGRSRSALPDNSVIVRSADGSVSSRTPFVASGLQEGAGASTARVHWAMATTAAHRWGERRARLGARRAQLRALSTASNHREAARSMVPGPRIRIISLVRGPWEVRIAHLVDGPSAPSSANQVVEVTGWAVPGSSVVHGLHGTPLRCGDLDASGPWSLALPLFGLRTAGAVRSVGTNPMARRCVMPVLRGTWDHDGVVAALVGLTADPLLVRAASEPGGSAVRPEVRVARTAVGVTVEVVWPDGAVQRLRPDHDAVLPTTI